MKVLRVKVTERGGGIEIDLGPEGYYNHRMTAYQNYLGGGMLGSIQNDCTIDNWRLDKKLLKIANRLAKKYHKMSGNTNKFNDQQKRPSRAY